MTNFEERVLRDLGELKAHMRWIVGNGNEGKIQELETRIQKHEAALQRTAGTRRGGGSSADDRAPCAGFDEGDTPLMTKQEFVQQAYAAASRSSERSGMPAMVTVAQAALESNWGQSKLSQEANNYFGIKAHGTHERIQMSTEECEGGANESRSEAEFAKYLSMLDCFQCSDGILLRGAPFMRRAREKRGDEAEIHRARSQSTGPPIRSMPRNCWRCCMK